MSGFHGTIDHLPTAKENKMGIDQSIKKNWIEIQKKPNTPVNALGVKIKDNDVKTLKVWKEEGIDKFVKK